MHPIAGFTQPVLHDDVIYEVNHAGEIVWTWIAGDHLNEYGFAPEELELVRHTPDPDYLHLNSMKPLGPNRWFTAGDQRFHPDNIIISSRNASVIAIIDRITGKIVWTLGPSHSSESLPTDECLGQWIVRAASTIRTSSPKVCRAQGTFSSSTTKALRDIRPFLYL
jgi:hypothetical protein